MKKSTFYTLFGIVCICSLALILLVRFSHLPNEHTNGFARRWLEPKEFKFLNELQISNSIQDIVGTTNDHLFFSTLNPQWLFMLDEKLQNQDTIFFPIKLFEKLLSAYTFFVDSPNVYLHANNIPALFIGSLVDTKKFSGLKLKTSLFTKSVQISPKYMVLRGFDSSGTRQTFQKINSMTGKIESQQVIVPQPKNDLGFSTDGWLKYDPFTKRILFVEFYQNSFFCLDSNLNLIYQGKTIDTTNTNSVSIKPNVIGNKEYLMPSSSRTLINKITFVNNGYLFINSGLIADNESPKLFRQNAIIDVYRIQNGTYVGSFYLPYRHENKIMSIVYQSDKLFVLYAKGIISVFNLNLGKI